MSIVLTKEQLLGSIKQLANDVGLQTAIMDQIISQMPTEYLDMYILDLYFRDYAYRDYWVLIHRDGHRVYAFTKYEMIGYLRKKFPGSTDSAYSKIWRKQGNEFFGYHVERRKGTKPL